MTQDYTVNNLIRLIYGECDLCERLELEFAMKTDTNLRDQYMLLQASYRSIEKVTFRPRKSTTNAILKFAAQQSAAA